MSQATQTNPLRDPSALARRYTVYGIVGIVVLGMSVHLMIMETNWSRMGSPSEIADTIASLWPSLSFIPKIIGPLLETALITPPVGVNLYIVHGVRDGGTMNDVIIGASPFVITMFVMIGLLVMFPQIALFLPQLFY